MDQVGERLDQLLAQPWLQGGQSTKLGDERPVGHRQQEQGCASGIPHNHVDQPRPLPSRTELPGHPHGLSTREEGRSGTRASLMILMRTQLLVEEVISLKNSGARER